MYAYNIRIINSEIMYMYDQGQGVDQNYEWAKEYYESAAKQGYADAQNNLGVFYANGVVVKQSFEIARAWWNKSVDKGRMRSLKNISLCLSLYLYSSYQQ